jgi:hypothetical protein
MNPGRMPQSRSSASEGPQPTPPLTRHLPSRRTADYGSRGVHRSGSGDQDRAGRRRFHPKQLELRCLLGAVGRFPQHHSTHSCPDCAHHGAHSCTDICGTDPGPDHRRSEHCPNRRPIHRRPDDCDPDSRPVYRYPDSNPEYHRPNYRVADPRHVHCRDECLRRGHDGVHLGKRWPVQVPLPPELHSNRLPDLRQPEAMRCDAGANHRRPDRRPVIAPYCIDHRVYHRIDHAIYWCVLQLTGAVTLRSRVALRLGRGVRLWVVPRPCNHDSRVDHHEVRGVQRAQLCRVSAPRLPVVLRIQPVH